jgi:starch-binding outer membrane protein, SusD/RagB family
MKKVIYRIAIAAIALTGTTSCESFLEREPTMTISKSEMFKDIEGLNYAVIGLYSSTISLFDGPLVPYSEARSGNLKLAKTMTTAYSSRMQPSYEFNNLYDDTYDSTNDLYEQFYKIINQTNDIIEACKTINYPDTKSRDKCHGEALFFRALSHFTLCNLYAPPYIASNLGNDQSIVIMDKSIPAFEYPIRSKLYKVYDLVISDLKQAEILLANNSRTAGIKQAWVSQAAVQALLARVYLYKNDWENAATYANKVIANSDYAPIANADYENAWKSTTINSEDILVFDFSNINSRIISTYYGIPDTDKSVYFSVSNDLKTLYTDSDVRSKLIVPLPGDNRDTVTIKFKAIGLKERYMSVLRLSEMYLIRAEASAENQDPIQARSDLNTIRLRADALATPIYPSGQALIDAIMLERRKELAFEGHTYYDFIRKGKGITRTDFNGVQNKDVPFPSSMLYLPFPKDAVEHNPNLK